MGDLGRGIGAPGHVQRTRPLVAEEEGVGEDDARQRVGGVRELEAGGDVARGVDVAVGRLQEVVHGDAGPVVGHARRLEVEAVRVGGSADAHQDLVAGERLGPSVTRVVHDLVRPAPLDARDLRAQDERHALGPHVPLDDGGGVGVLAR